MALVLNCLKQEVSVQALGDWFTFKGEQMKELNDNKATFIGDRKAYLGFVRVPEAFADVEYRNSEEGKAALEALKKQGITARCDFLRQTVNNELVSLKGDLDRANIQADVRAYMSPGATAAMEELASYKRSDAEAAAAKIKHIEELEKLLET